MDKKYYSYPKERLNEGRIPVKCLGDSGEVFSEIAHIMVDAIEENNKKRKEDSIHLSCRTCWTISSICKTCQGKKPFP